MALLSLRVLLLGVLAAAVEDVPVRWSGSARASLPCEVPHAHLIPARRPPPPLEGDERARPKPYMWWKGDDKISSKWILPSGVLEVPRRREGAEGVYHCAVRHHGGAVMGYPVHLKFATMEKQFTEHPKNVTSHRGQPVALSCSISSAPPADVFWFKDDQPITDTDRYFTISNQLLITDVTDNDSGSYRCAAVNSQLNKTRTSHTGRLQVTDTIEDLDVAFLPLNVEHDIAVPSGSRVVLPCPITGSNTRMLWEHTPPGGKTMELEVNREVFVINDLNKEQEGTYTCSVEGHKELNKTFTVTVTEPPEITIPPSGKETLRASTVRFNCTASGRPEPTISWYKDGTVITIAGRINVRKSMDGKRNELVISGVTSDDAGVYQCFASNVAGVASSWAVLNVTGADAAAPTDVRCWPIGDHKIRVAWDKPAMGEVVAYTVHSTPEESKAGISLPGHPRTDTEDDVTVQSSLTPYRFQVRAYSRLTSTIKNAASDLSKGAVCQGQGVPIKMAKLEDGRILVSWKQYSDANPGVVEWILQHRPVGSNHERNITLDGSVTNYTLPESPNTPQEIRLLGSRTAKWLQQDLSLVPWVTTANAGHDLESGEVTAVPQDVDFPTVGSRDFTVSWRCDEADDSDERYVYMVCAKKIDGIEKCHESKRNSATFDGLQPNSVYEVRVQARIPNRALGGPFSPPYTVTTMNEGPQRFKDLKGVFINATSLNVSWNGPAERYTVHYSAQLRLPVEQWDALHTRRNHVLINNIRPGDTTYVMVTGYEPEEHSKIVTFTPLKDAADKEEIHYEYTNTGIRVWWKGMTSGTHTVSYEQNITRPLEQWRSIHVKGTSVELTGLNPDLPTYVMVSTNKKPSSDVLNIPPHPRTDHYYTWYLAVGLVCGVIVLGLMTTAAVCLWRRHKKNRSIRHRRRTASSPDGNEEGAEMKNVGGRLANGGGSKDAGEPLLNGHVHITENPTSKTPNGKMKKGVRYEAAFDVSRYDDADVTMETVIDPDVSTSTAYNLFDTSRRPDIDSRSSQNISTNNSFNKLPDDNMNSELTRSTDFDLDNSKIQPTLQPNG